MRLRLVLPVLAACLCLSPVPRIAAEAAKPTIGPGERMLFIGNSYTANEGGVFGYLAKALAVADRLQIKTDKRIYYGRPLEAMLTDEVKTAIASDQFDSVVITSGQLATMKEFHELIKAGGKRTIVFATWEGRHPGHRSTPEEYTAATRSRVAELRQMQKQTGATVVPVSVVYHDLTLNPPKGMPRVDYLWRADNIHQNELGTLVNAWMFYAILMNKSPVGVDFEMPPFVVGEAIKTDPAIRVTPALRNELQERVWKVAQAWKAGKSHLE